MVGGLQFLNQTNGKPSLNHLLGTNAAFAQKKASSSRLQGMVFPYLALEEHFMFFKGATINSTAAPFVDNLLATRCSKYLI